jgi:hypothetical protein
MSLPARLLNIFAAPGEVFDYIKRKEHSVANWITPAVLMIAVAIIGGAFIFSNEAVNHQIDEMMDKQIESQKLPAQQAEMARKIGGTVAKVGIVAGPAVMAFILPFWSGLFIWLIGAKILKGNFGYMKGVEAAGLSSMILVLDSILKPLLVILKGNAFVTLSPVLFLNNFNPQNPMHNALNMLSVMLIWSVVVQSIAVSRLSGRSLAVSLAWMFGVTIVITGMCVGFGLGMQALRPH